MNRALFGRWLLPALAVGATLSSVAFGQTAMFTVKQLANIPGGVFADAIGINNAGDVVGAVVGTSVCPDGCAVVWNNGSSGAPTLLGAVAGASESSAVSINNAGEIAGYLVPFPGSGSTQAVIWNKGTATVLPSGDQVSTAAFVNDAGQVVGEVQVSATEWNGLTETALALLPNYTNAAAYGVNNNNLIVGSSCCGTEDAERATVWRGTVPSVLPQITGGGGDDVAFAVNNLGLIVGQAGTSVGRHAAAWANGVVTDLGVISGLSAAYAVNGRGIIVGESASVADGVPVAVLWSKVGAHIQDLNKLISSTQASEYRLTKALAINDNCTITVQGTTRKENQNQALILVLNDPSQCVNGM
jgi:probable HAF family extracellular repeat protein